MQRKIDYFKLLDPDHQLELWEKWVEIRKEEIIRLSEKVQRPPVDLTMNLLEKVREEIEQKIVLEHAQIESKATLRGQLFEQPLRLEQQCYCEPVYEVHRTRAELGKPKIIQHIGVPNYIQVTDKGLLGVSQRKNFYHLDFEYEKYKSKREDQLKEKIKKIDPFRPQIDKLYIKGNKPKKPAPKLPLLPEVSITSDSEKTPGDRHSIFALRINNTVIDKDVPKQYTANLQRIQNEHWHENCSTWSYYFCVPTKRAGRAKLNLKNLGTVSLRFCMKKIKKTIPFIPENIYEQVFYFKKNEDVLSPGQSREIFLTFISDKPGIYSEFWEINFGNVNFFNNLSDKFIIELYGDAHEDMQNIINKVDTLKMDINHEAISSIMKEMIDDAINTAVSTKSEQYPYKHRFLESEMFVMKNPICYYHNTDVLILHETFREMAPGETWDLTIASWRQKMLKKDFTERMNYYDILKTRHQELLRPLYRPSNLMEVKYQAVHLLLGQFADKLDSKYNEIFNGIENRMISEKRPSIMRRSYRSSIISLDSTSLTTIRNIFYLYAYESLATTIETCAGILDSLDLNRWLDFDFCQ